MRMPYLAALVVYLPFLALWMCLRKRKPVIYRLDNFLPLEPLPLRLGFKDHIKAFISWVFLFMRVFSVKPGFYDTGLSLDGNEEERDLGGSRPGDTKREREEESIPLLVTCNNFLTVFILARRLRPRRVRLLVVDTDGINVWCAAGKGRFSASEIMDKASRAGLLNLEESAMNRGESMMDRPEGMMDQRESGMDRRGREKKKKIRMVLPKFSLSGVNISELKKAGVQPVIGPLYAKDLPAYLDAGTFADRIHDRVRFGWQSRAFTALPTAVQFFLYFLGVYIVLLGSVSPLIIWTATALAFLYPILFPYLPGRQFAVKGISLAFFASLVALFISLAGKILDLSQSPAVLSFLSSGKEESIIPSLYSLIPLAVFLFATSLFVALSFTGNSAVSNYSRVRKEIARYLPVVVVLYLLLIPALLLF